MQCRICSTKIDQLDKRRTATCSILCAKEDRRRRSNQRRKPRRPIKTVECKICGSSFNTSMSHKKTCSVRCNTENNRRCARAYYSSHRIRPTRGQSVRACIVCGLNYWKSPCECGPRVCSSVCRDEARKEANLRWYYAHSERIASYKKSTRDANIDLARERERRNRANNPNHREQQRRYSIANYERLLEASRRWRAANLKKVRAAGRRYANANHEKRREYEAQAAAALQVIRNVMGSFRYKDRFLAKRVLQQLENGNVNGAQ